MNRSVLDRLRIGDDARICVDHCIRREYLYPIKATAPLVICSDSGWAVAVDGTNPGDSGPFQLVDSSFHTGAEAGLNRGLIAVDKSV